MLSVTIPLLLSESLGIFVLSWAFVLMFSTTVPDAWAAPSWDWEAPTPSSGWEDFIEMFNGTSVQANLFRTSLKNALIFAFAILPLNLAITLPLAYLLEARSENVSRLSTGPYVLPVPDLSVGVALIWMSMYDPARLDQRHHPHVWWSARLLAFRPRARVWRVSRWPCGRSSWAYLWQDYGYNMVIFIAALQAIPQELKDAALIDGATPVASVHEDHPAAHTSRPCCSFA